MRSATPAIRWSHLAVVFMPTTSAMAARLSRLAKAGVVCLVCACSTDMDMCPAVDCGTPVAVTVTVTSSVSGAPVPNAYFYVDDPRYIIPCDHAGKCSWHGFAGTYTVYIGAPGLQTDSRIAVVRPGTAHCCLDVVPVHFDVALAPLS